MHHRPHLAQRYNFQNFFRTASGFRRTRLLNIPLESIARGGNEAKEKFT
jgi:hypothetical protein